MVSELKAYVALTCGSLSIGTRTRRTVGLITDVMKKQCELFKNCIPHNFYQAYEEYQLRFSKKNIKNELSNDLDNLKKGKCMIFNMSSKRHSMAGMLKRGNHHYTFYKVNTGKGVSRHRSKLDERGVCLYQVVQQIKKISKENAKCFLQTFPLKQLTVQSIYEDIIPILKGKEKADLEDSRYWNTKQIGRSCAGQSELSLLRIVMTQKNYEKFLIKLQEEAVAKLYKTIIKGSENCLCVKVAVVDIIKRLEHLYIKKGKLLPKEIIIKRNTVQNMIEYKITKKAKKKLKPFFELNLKEKKKPDFVKMIGTICYHLVQGQMENAFELLTIAFESIQKKKLTQGQKKELCEIADSVEQIVDKENKYIRLNKSEDHLYVYKTVDMINLFAGLAVLFLKCDIENKFLSKYIDLYCRNSLHHSFSSSPWQNEVFESE